MRGKKSKKLKKTKCEPQECPMIPAGPQERSWLNTYPCIGHSGPGADIVCGDVLCRHRTSVVQTKTDILGEEEYRRYPWIIAS